MRMPFPPTIRASAAVTLATAVLLSCGPRSGSSGTHLNAADLLASTALPDLSLNVRPLSAYSGSGGILLVFVSTRCRFPAGAEEELPVAAAGLIQYGVKTVVVNSGEPAEAVSQKYAGGIYAATVVYDTTDQTARRWNVASVPTALLLDAKANTLYRGAPVCSKVSAALAKHLGLPASAVQLRPPETTSG